MSENLDYKKNNSIGKYIKGGAFLAYFFGTFIGIIYFMNKNPRVGGFLFGMLLFVMGLGAIISQKGTKATSKLSGNMFLGLFILIGLCIMIGCGISLWGDKFGIEFSQNNLLIIGVVSVEFLVGTYFVFGTLSEINEAKRRCTVSVSGQCIDYNTKFNGSKIIRFPVFSYNYNGVQYETTLNTGGKIDLPKINTKEQIYINPLDPEDVYRPSKKQTMTIIFLGLVCYISGSLIVYLVFIK